MAQGQHCAGPAESRLVFEPRYRQVQRLGDHLGIRGWIIVMSFRPEAFRLDFRHVQFWRGCLRFLVKRRQPLS